MGICRHSHKSPTPGLRTDANQEKPSQKAPSSLSESQRSAVQWDPVGTRHGVRKGADLAGGGGLVWSKCSSSGH